MTPTESAIVRDPMSRPANGTSPAPAPAPVAAPGTHIADPGPLGLAGFAATTFVLSLFNAGMVGNPKLEAVVLPFALLYGGIAQLLAGMWEFKKNNTFGAVAFTSYGAFWISLFYYIKFVAPTLPPADAHTATGIFLLTWTIFTVYMTIASIKTNAVLTIVFATLLVAFALLTLGAFNPDTTSLTHAGGYIGIVVAFLAWYASAAAVVNSTWGRAVLPLFPARKS
jgi:succinate-acetate transporter protein